MIEEPALALVERESRMSHHEDFHVTQHYTTQVIEQAYNASSFMPSAKGFDIAEQDISTEK
jgi:hypothetical protein